jgi:hypothetical protein
MWLQRFARPPRGARRPGFPAVPRLGARGRRSVVVAAHGVVMCVAIHLVHGYALVARVRVEVVPSASAAAPSLPGLCATGVAKW